MELPDDAELGLRPLTARSVIASTLLGTHPPVLPTRVLIAAVRLFGVSDSAARTALSRMVGSGEVVQENGSYRLVGDLLGRQQSQDVGRRAERRPWDGDWTMVIVGAVPRSAADRALRRRELAAARLAELREGVWVRPDNLSQPVDRVGPADAMTGTFRPEQPLPPAATLWDLDRWCRRAAALGAEVTRLTPGLQSADTTLLAPGFVVSAAVLRLFRTDPLLPDELLPIGWPGDDLRDRYDTFDRAYRTLLRSWFKQQ